MQNKFQFNVPEKVAHRFLEKKFPAIWRVVKSRYRTFIKSMKGMEAAIAKIPDGVDPNHWKEFVLQCLNPKAKELRTRNARYRKKNKVGHTLGRQSYAQKLYNMVSILN